MSRTFFANELEGTATFWRILRRDGVALGFTSHDRDLMLGSLRLRAAPGMLSAAISRTADFAPDSAEIRGALAHDAIAAEELSNGQFDGAQVESGIVDWETGEHAVLYRGEMGAISRQGTSFEAELLSAKAQLARDDIPRTSPTCRAEFCGRECGVNPARHTVEGKAQRIAADSNAVAFVRGGTTIVDPLYAGGTVRWFDGPHAGVTMQVIAISAEGFVLDRPLDPALATGTSARLRTGCDHTLATCQSRFGNAVNFRGEPFVPGNDLLTRYPSN
ncbi:DUF2163 domain-containing protein [Paraurantiacibacter namhicola]|uniref:Bacteriophage phiJL001 Gp84 C-terminal domain-containing protein n=1 Tax=Paraurantiacibacter namhicola TaxID=645517 RepID=A0A1C7D5H1_9SPHN|nr:DUF2163 domain-containing protein [Paraurantiacibacter namhicola]ANU06602.1 hypothetical protein A6F65_00275 [Paraurantiacibacter namhicola]